MAKAEAPRFARDARRAPFPAGRGHGALRPVNGGADATVLAAFAVGFVSFISPCVLPLVPGYLSALSGIAFAELKAGEGKAKVLGPALIFCLSFTVMFVALGMTATGI